jgi:delta24-sterol reductase
MKTLQEHQTQIKNIARQIRNYQLIAPQKKLRFYHGGTNSTRNQQRDDYCWVDIASLNGVLEINSAEGYAWVEPNVSMDELVRVTLSYGFIPAVVMELPGITVGGGINGASLESSSL